MRRAQKMLIDSIKAKGEMNGEIIKVDRILNHLVDIKLIKAIGEDITAKFKDTDFIFAKKKNPITMKGFFSAESYSFTKNETTTLYVSKEVLQKGDRILFIDDFYARGNTLKAVKNILEQAGAELAGCAVVIDKQNSPEIHSILTLNEIRKGLG